MVFRGISFGLRGQLRVRSHAGYYNNKYRAPTTSRGDRHVSPCVGSQIMNNLFRYNISLTYNTSNFYRNTNVRGETSLYYKSTVVIYGGGFPRVFENGDECSYKYAKEEWPAKRKGVGGFVMFYGRAVP